MRFTKSSLVRLALCLSCAFTIPAMAAPVRVFPHPEKGHVRPPLWVKPEAKAAPHTVSNPGSAPYTPAQVQSAYGFNKLTQTGAGQTIAIVDAYDDSQYIQSDLNAFCSEFGLPAASVNIIYAAGSKPAANSGWQQEESLDVEWAHAIAPAARILLVEAAGTSSSQLLQAVQAAVKNGATVVSMSWGGDESSGETANDSSFTASGVTFVASAGDDGAGVEWPAASANVLSVGGTSLLLDSNGNWSSESAWTNGGGGISAYESQPAWQSGWFPTPFTPIRRGVPDVAYLADPNYGVYVCYQGSWYEFGGTSVGAPQWAALIALANQGRSSTFSGANSVLYALANGGGKTTYGGYSINPSYFHDIASGDDGTAANDYAIVGYDLVTGVGSPLASAVVPALSGTNTAPAPTPTFAIAATPASQSVAAGGTANYTVNVTPSGGYSGVVDFSVSGLPAGATASFIPATVTASGSTTLAIATASTTPAGSYTVTVTARDSGGAVTKSANVALTITSPAKTDTVSSVSYSASGVRYTTLNIAMSVVNNLGSPVPNAAVTITLYYNGVASASGTAETAANGQVVFTLANARPGYYSSVVTAVNATGLTWNGKYPSETIYDPY